jgi:adenylate cyclase
VIGDSGEEQRLIKTLPRKGFRFVGAVHETNRPSGTESVPDSRFESSTPALALPDKPSIAVLPFENLSGDPEQEYFADGMVEEITIALSRFKSLFVIARNSSFTFKGRAVDIKEVGRQLGVRYVLEGSVRKASRKVRITGQLIDAVTGAHIWADRFERDLTDIFALQDEVTAAVVSAIQPKLLQTETAMATRRRPENLTAYDFYLRAMHQYYISTREGLAEAIRLARRALELDPRFGLVAALAGICHMNNVLWGYAVNAQFDRKEAVRLLRLALGVDDDDPDTLTWASLISAFMVGDCETEIEMVDRAVALNPNSFRAWNGRGWVFRNAGLPDEAVRSFERAIRMSPVDPALHHSFVGMGYAFIELSALTRLSSQGRKPNVRTPSIRNHTAVSRPLSPISDVTPRRVRRRRPGRAIKRDAADGGTPESGAARMSDIETAKPRDRLVDKGADVIVLADVGVDELGLRTERAQFFNERLAGLITPAGNDHLRALPGEGDGGGATDAGQGSRDQYDWVTHL